MCQSNSRWNLNLKVECVCVFFSQPLLLQMHIFEKEQIDFAFFSVEYPLNLNTTTWGGLKLSFKYGWLGKMVSVSGFCVQTWLRGDFIFSEKKEKIIQLIMHAEMVCLKSSACIGIERSNRDELAWKM